MAVTLPKASYRAPDLGPLESVADNAGVNIFNAVEAYGEGNGYRMRSYHRLDLGVSFEWGDRSGLHALKVGTYNTYNRKNPYFLQTERASSGALQARATSLLPTVPYINYRFQF